MNLRKATSSDLEIVLHHRREIFREMGYSTDPIVAALADSQARLFFAKAFEEGHYLGWLVEDPEGWIAAGSGVILVEYHPSPTNPHLRRPWVVNMYTEAAYRRRGLARILMEAMIEWTRAQGYTNLFLHASEEGRPLYQGLGFAVSNEMRLKL